jgi:hypothetical protein
LGPDRQDSQLTIEKDDIDRKPHEGGVDRPSGADQHSITARKIRATEQTAEPAEHPVGDFAALADGLPVAVDEADPFRHYLSMALRPRVRNGRSGWSD